MTANLDHEIREAVRLFWTSRSGQSKAQQARGRSDQGNRSAVTGGAHMDGFIYLLGELLRKAGVPAELIYLKKAKRVLPGFFRPAKEWDLVVVHGASLLVALEVKSQIGSLGNNFNNRAEEAIGNAVDIWTAFREGAFGSPSPWAGYLMLLEDSERSNRPVNIREPHFPAFPEFKGSSYALRYELLCRKLTLERHYNAAALLMSSKAAGVSGDYVQPAADLTFERLASSMIAHVKGALGLT